MYYIILIILSLCLYIINNYSLSNFNKFFILRNLVDKNFSKPQAFHTNPTPRIGGLFFFLNFLVFTIFYTFYFSDTVPFAVFGIIPFFLIGFFDDIKIFESPKFRIITLIMFIIICIFFLEINIVNTGFEILDNLLINYTIFKYLFLILCFLTIINGSNFIDGFNGLLIIHAIIITSILLYFNINTEIYNDLLIFLISLLIILLFNFPNSKLFLGDSGAYSIGFLLSYYAIKTASYNLNISPVFICILLFYLFFEVLFSFTRKKIYKLNPILPDRNHLHMILFKIINQKLNNEKLKANYLTSIILNTFYLLTILPSLFFYNNNFMCKIYFVVCILLYLFLYLTLKTYQKNI